MTPTEEDMSLKLQRIAESWLGTPFRANASQKGVGVSCQKLVAEIYREAGVIEVSVPEVPMDYYRYARDGLIEPFMAGLDRFIRIDGTTPRTGDLLAFRVGRIVHHLGVALDGNRFVHCIRGPGVIISDLADPTWGHRLAIIWRPK